MTILTALQAGSTSVLRHVYGVDEDVLSPFQWAADVVDPPRNPSSTDGVVVVEENSYRDSPSMHRRRRGRGWRLGLGKGCGGRLAPHVCL
jgi:hypothetical protein